MLGTGEGRDVMVASGVIALIVSLTMVPTAPGEMVGILEPKHATVNIRTARPAAPIL